MVWVLWGESLGYNIKESKSVSQVLEISAGTCFYVLLFAGSVGHISLFSACHLFVVLSFLPPLNPPLMFCHSDYPGYHG